MSDAPTQQNQHITRCLRLVEASNQSDGWGLDTATCTQYAYSISGYVAATEADGFISLVIGHYHADHAHVAALMHSEHPEHNPLWQHWMHRVLGVLRKHNQQWSDNGSFDYDDLVQVALVALAQALPSYRYHSRFSTWAYQVVLQRVYEQRRHNAAQKRAAQPDSLSQLSEFDHPADPLDRAAAMAGGRQLWALIANILAQQPDQRLVTIFQLWAVDDRRVAEIGALLRLHPSRARALVRQARLLLHAHPAIQAWNDDNPDAAPNQSQRQH